MFHKVSSKTILPDFQRAVATLLLDMHGWIKMEDQVKEHRSYYITRRFQYQQQDGNKVWENASCWGKYTIVNTGKHRSINYNAVTLPPAKVRLLLHLKFAERWQEKVQEQKKTKGWGKLESFMMHYWPKPKFPSTSPPWVPTLVLQNKNPPFYNGVEELILGPK